MDTGILLAIIIGALTGIALFSLIVGLMMSGKKFRRELELEQLINDINTSELDDKETRTGLPKEKSWFGYWFKLASGAGIDNKETPKRAGYIAIAILLGGIFFGTYGWPGILPAGLIMGAAGVAIYRLMLLGFVTKRMQRIDKQLPNLLAGMRSNLSASMPPQQSMLSQIDSIGSPLREELISVKADIDMNIPFDEALENLADRVPSRELRFLISSMRTAISEGADLEKLITTLQDIISDRTVIKDKLSAAVAQAQPAIYVTVLAIPLGFIFSLTSDDKNREFWFSTQGIIVMLVVAGLYASSLFAARMQIKKVKEA